MIRTWRLIAAAVLLGVLAAGCQVGSEMWGPCAVAASGDPFGTDGTWVLVCRGGTWEPVMTVDEFVRSGRGEHVSPRQPLPTRPRSSTTTTSTTSTTTTPPAPVLDIDNFVPAVGFYSPGDCTGTTVGQPRRSAAQSFVAGRTGTLAAVDLVVQPVLHGGSVDPLRVEIVTAPAGVPTSTVIGSGTYTGTGSPDVTTLTHIELDEPAPVVTGTPYAVVASTGADPCPSVGRWNLFVGMPSSYAGGQSWVSQGTPWDDEPPVDWSFRTWVRS